MLTATLAACPRSPTMKVLAYTSMEAQPAMCVSRAGSQAFISQVWSTIRKRGPPPEDNRTFAAQLMRLWCVRVSRA